MPSLRSIRETSRRPSETHFWATPRTIWNETGRPLKKAWATLWVSGTVLLAFGIWGDNTGFWTDRPYLSNTLSEVTCAAFGVPVALVLLQRLESLESDAAEARSARRMARRVSAGLESAVGVLASGGLAGMQSVKQYLRNQRESLVPNGDYWRPAAAPRLHYQPYIDAIESTMKKVEELFIPEINQHLAEISAHWSILTTESRFRLLGSGNEWLPGFQAEQLGALVMAVTSSTLEDWRRKGLYLQDWYHREDQQPESTSYGEMETLRAFDSWYGDIINYIDAVIDLTTNSAYAARTLASPGLS